MSDLVKEGPIIIIMRVSMGFRVVIAVSYGTVEPAYIESMLQQLPAARSRPIATASFLSSLWFPWNRQEKLC
ncbi:hypothetical protein BDW68DRAFT_67372 [Aspergillus falconensis]